MKNISIFISAVLFSFLFYQQNIGLNLLLFSVLTCLIVTQKNPKLLKNKNFLFKIIAYLITGLTVYLHNSSFTILVNIISFFTLVGCASEPKASIYIHWLNGIYKSTVAFFSKLYVKNDFENEIEKKKKIDYKHWSKIIGIPLVLSLIFIALYRNANPVFDNIISKINFSFINIQWIIFTSLGYYLFYNITSPVIIETITKIDLNTSIHLPKINLDESKTESIKNEKQLGLVLLVVLSILILFFLVTDVFYLTEIYQMTAAQLSKEVHTGVNALIISVVLAVIIILYFYRGELNFYKQIKDLKIITAIWIFLNLTVVITTILKNAEYITSFGFTYKRIGVLFFLILTAIGLITTYIKVFTIKNIWYLLRKNLNITFVILIVSTTINWDKMITHYNIKYADELDINYLINLSNKNAFILKEYKESNKVFLKNQKRIDKKYESYLNDLKNNSWQEVVYDNLKIKK